MAARPLRLTDHQAQKMAEWRERWAQIALSTEPADRPRAEKAIFELYRATGHKLPKRIVWCGSPLSMTLTRLIALHERSDALERARTMAKLRSQVGASVWESTLESVRATEPRPLWQAIRSWAWKQAAFSASAWLEGPTKTLLRFSLLDPVDASIRGAVEASAIERVRASIRQPLIQSVIERVRRPIESEVWHVRRGAGAMLGSLYGQHDAGWLASYSYFREVCGLTEQPAMLVAACELARSAGWALPGLGICWVSERHSSLTRDAEGRLHNLSGPSVLYPDGWAIYAVRGVIVPPAWIEHRRSLDPTTALTWGNAEQRRAAAEIVGWDRVLNVLSPRTINVHSNPEIGTLLRCDLPGAPRQQFLRVQCGTGRVFVLPVPPHVTTALEANAWTYGLRPDEYVLETRT